jgi:hypothetical protein
MKMRRFVLGLGLLLAAIGQSAAVADEMAVPLHLSRPLSPNGDRTYCTDSDTTLAHPDGGVLTFDKICVVFHEFGSPGVRFIQSALGTNVKWMNHHLGATFSEQFFIRASPTLPLQRVMVGPTQIPCHGTPFQVTVNGKDDAPQPILANASDNAVLYIQWTNPDSSLC